jgi:membrane protein YdbS with pleckstrin-like domain
MPERELPRETPNAWRSRTEPEDMMTTIDTTDNDTKVCPSCAETIKRGALKCRFCNCDLKAFAGAQDSETEKLLFKGHPATIYSAGQWVIVVLTLGLAYLAYMLRSMSITYEVTTQRVKIERGLLSKVKDSVELFTIEHFDIHTPLGMRLLGTCALQLRSSDSSYQNLVIYGVDNLESMADTLRECSLRERTRRRVTSLIQP